MQELSDLGMWASYGRKKQVQSSEIHEEKKRGKSCVFLKKGLDPPERARSATDEQAGKRQAPNESALSAKRQEVASSSRKFRNFVDTLGLRYADITANFAVPGG